MAIAENPCDLPIAVFKAPNDYKICHAFARASIELAESMRPLLDRTEVLDWENPDGPRNQLPAEISAGS